MPKITVLVGPPGSGKSTYSASIDAVRVSQDDQGKVNHEIVFKEALSNKKDIVIDRMNFDVGQRRRYLDPAVKAGYETEIVVFHVPLKTCLDRCNQRKGHPTVKTPEDASQAVNFFFTHYGRVEDSEADKVTRLGWVDDSATKCVWSDLDGTLADVEHRRGYVRVEKPEKPNWKKFFDEMVNDPVDPVCKTILDYFANYHPVVFATGRPDSYKRQTEDWIQKVGAQYPGSFLFMRARNDHRKDDIVKEIILEFEVKTRYGVLFALDDRDQVVRMLRKHGIKVLQVAEGNF